MAECSEGSCPPWQASPGKGTSPGWSQGLHWPRYGHNGEGRSPLPPTQPTSGWSGSFGGSVLRSGGTPTRQADPWQRPFVRLSCSWLCAPPREANGNVRNRTGEPQAGQSTHPLLARSVMLPGWSIKPPAEQRLRRPPRRGGRMVALSAKAPCQTEGLPRLFGLRAVTWRSVFNLQD